MRELLRAALTRLKGEGGEIASITRLDTQYGGGKTHGLIALVHAVGGMAGVSNVEAFVDPGKANMSAVSQVKVRFHRMNQKLACASKGTLSQSLCEVGGVALMPPLQPRRRWILPVRMVSRPGRPQREVPPKACWSQGSRVTRGYRSGG